MERARKLYLMGDMPEGEYCTLRETLRGKLSALQPMQDTDLESAAVMLETLGTLLENATLKELDDVFHALLTSVYLDGGEKGPVLLNPSRFSSY